jgi:hypothetical protein
MLRLAVRRTTRPSLLPRTSPSFTTTTRRALSETRPSYDDSKNDPYHKQSTAATGTSAGPHEGSSSRTDNQISFEYPDDGNLGVREAQVQGRGGKSNN